MKPIIRKIETYLYEFHCDAYDYVMANEHIKGLEISCEIPSFPSCSTLRSGNFFGRNFDFFFNNLISFVVKTPHTDEHFASIGMACTTGECTSDNIDEGISPEVCNYIPFCTWDGINEYGVTFCTNVTPSIDLDCQTTGTNPGKPLLYSTFIGRLILDKAKSAKEAITMLNHFNIVTPNISILGSVMDLHFLIADEQETYVVEFVNNRLVCKKNATIMTNFYVTLPLQAHSCGVERYRFLKDHIDQGAISTDAMSKLMEKVHYSQTYSLCTNPFWYTDHFADGISDGIDINMSNIYQYTDYIRKHTKQMTFTRGDGYAVPWHTMHTTIYDIKNRKFRLYVQEHYGHFYEYGIK